MSPVCIQESIRINQSKIKTLNLIYEPLPLYY